MSSTVPGLGHRTWTAARSAREQRRLLGVAAGALFVLAFAFAVLTDAVEVGALVFAPAVALVASLAGPGPGALAGLSAAGLYVTAAVISGGELTALSVSSKTVPLVIVGAGIGRLSQWLTEQADEATRARREADAVEASFHAVFEHALDAFIILDDDGRILGANTAPSRRFSAARARN